MRRLLGAQVSRDWAIRLTGTQGQILGSFEGGRGAGSGGEWREVRGGRPGV